MVGVADRMVEVTDRMIRVGFIIQDIVTIQPVKIEVLHNGMPPKSRNVEVRLLLYCFVSDVAEAPR